MKFKQACSRDESHSGGASLEELIYADNEVRVIDACGDSLPLEKVGFGTSFPGNAVQLLPPSSSAQG